MEKTQLVYQRSSLERWRREHEVAPSGQGPCEAACRWALVDVRELSRGWAD